jgi:membrane associated rhomboid family serine protease
MIPLRDTTRSKTIPFVNYIIIATCGLVFLYENSLGEYLGAFFHRFAVIPSDVAGVVFRHDSSFRAILSRVAHAGIGTLLPLVTSMFLHGGWMHLIGNMLYLYIFGDNIEDRLGHLGYLFFYLLAGIGATLTEVYFQQHSPVPLIGASGAIAGVLGAYFILYPRAKIMTLIPLFVFFPVVELSAFFFLGFWFIMQFISGSLASGADVAGGVAWWAHAGGFIAGAALLPVFLLFRRFTS